MAPPHCALSVGNAAGQVARAADSDGNSLFMKLPRAAGLSPSLQTSQKRDTGGVSRRHTNSLQLTPDLNFIDVGPES